MTSRLRGQTRALRSPLGGASPASGMSSASWNWYQAPFLLATCTVQSRSALPAVSSVTGCPAALNPHTLKRTAWHFRAPVASL